MADERDEVETSPGTSTSAGTTEAPSRHIGGNGSGPPLDGSVESTASEAADAQPAAEPKTGEPNKRRVRKGTSWLRKLTELPILIALAFAIAILIKTFLVQAFYIPSESMLPTLAVGDRVLVEKLSYRFGGPDRGDVVVFEKDVFGAPQEPDRPWYRDAQVFVREMLGLPTGEREDYIKRVVATGGDTIRYVGSPRRLIINDRKVEQPFIKGGRDRSSPTITSADCERLHMQKAGKGCRVPAGSVFVMGDNRGNSEDSRVLGPIDEEKIVGRAFLIIWPPRDFGGL